MGRIQVEGIHATQPISCTLTRCMNIGLEFIFSTRLIHKLNFNWPQVVSTRVDSTHDQLYYPIVVCGPEGTRSGSVVMVLIRQKAVWVHHMGMVLAS